MILNQMKEILLKEKISNGGGQEPLGVGGGGGDRHLSLSLGARQSDGATECRRIAWQITDAIPSSFYLLIFCDIFRLYFVLDRSELVVLSPERRREMEDTSSQGSHWSVLGISFIQ
jgi:hypothetical protein